MDANTWNDRYAAAELVWSAEPNQFVEAEIDGLRPGRAVDLAAGEGRNALWLARRGWQVTAIDFAVAGLDRGRSREAASAAQQPAHSIEWLCADVLSWTQPATYDLALIAYLQLPAAERRAVVRAAFDALVPDGILLLIAHDSTNLLDGTGGPQSPEVLMSADDVIADLAHCSPAAEIENAGRRPRTVEPEHGGDPALTAWDCVVRVRRPR